MPISNPLIELNKIGLTRESTSPLPDINDVANGSETNNDSSNKDDKDSNIVIDMSKTENDSNVDSLGIYEVNKLINSNTFEEDEEIQEVDKATLSLG